MCYDLDMNKDTNTGEIIIYKDKEGPELRVEVIEDTVWLTQAQMAELFDKDVRTISEHIQNIYKEKELKPAPTIRKFRIVQKEGKREIARQVDHYNLDIIISVGYRVKSNRGTQFRIWATQKLRDYILKGYVVNESRLLEKHVLKMRELEQAHKLIQHAIETRRLEGYEKELLNIITDYTNTWLVLNRYDSGTLLIEDVSTKTAKSLEYDKIKKAIERFKARLISKGEASDFFGNEVAEKFAALLGTIQQTFSKNELYESLEEKAAHLFYFTIKDHPFVDGNKRIGSLLLILYLIENNYFYNKKGERKINDNALSALALLVAESKPDQKDVMVKLIVNMINKK
jgi:death-on-curing family protein